MIQLCNCFQMSKNKRPCALNNPLFLPILSQEIPTIIILLTMVTPLLSNSHLPIAAASLCDP